MKNLILPLIMITLLSQAQEIDNKLLGKFTTKDKKSLYSSFSFDNNGKSEIDEFGKGDYFIKGDTLIIFPDKDIFKFILKNNKLIGVSNWVDKEVWTKNNEAIKNNRKNDEMAKNNANLLNEYYVKTRLKSDPILMLFDEKLKEDYINNLNNLCDKNLVRACKELFGMVTLENAGGVGAVIDNKTKSKIKPNEKLQRIIDKVITLDTTEGEYLNELYQTMISNTDKGK